MNPDSQLAPCIQSIINSIVDNFRTYPPGKANRLLMQQLSEIIAQTCLTQDCSTLVSVLGYIKQNEKIHPTELENSNAICLNLKKPRIDCSMNIKFERYEGNSKGLIHVRIILTYYNPYYGKIITSKITNPENNFEKKMKQLANEIETKYAQIT